MSDITKETYLEINRMCEFDQARAISRLTFEEKVALGGFVVDDWAESLNVDEIQAQGEE